MKPLAIVGIVLIVLGIAGLAVGRFSYTTEEKVVDVGPLEATVEPRRDPRRGSDRRDPRRRRPRCTRPPPGLSAIRKGYGGGLTPGRRRTVTLPTPVMEDLNAAPPA